MLICSGDGHLSVIDVRSNKAAPLSVSDDQEDELLSIAQIKGGSKAVVGSTLGVLSIWNRAKGWQDSVDRIPGHPASVDALVALSPDIIATGSEDGMIRVMQILPNKFRECQATRRAQLTAVGVIATHEEYPIERIKLDRNGKWLGSVSHDDCIKLTDCEDLFEESDEEGGGDEDEDMDEDGEDDEEEDEDAEEEDSDSDSDVPEKKRKQGGKGGMGDMGRSSRKEEKTSFFDDL